MKGKGAREGNHKFKLEQKCNSKCEFETFYGKREIAALRHLSDRSCSTRPQGTHEENW